MLPCRLSILFISSSEDPYDASCVGAPAFVLPPALPGTALSSVLDPSLPSPLESSGVVPRSPPTSQVTLPTRLPRLSPLLHPLVKCGAGASPCAPLARGQKPPRSTEAGEHRRLRLSSPPVPVLRHHRRSHPCSRWGWQAWPCRAHPNSALPVLPYHVHYPAPYPFVPFENPLPAGRRGADCPRLVGWILPKLSGSSATAMPPSPPCYRALAS